MTHRCELQSAVCGPRRYVDWLARDLCRIELDNLRDALRQPRRGADALLNTSPEDMERAVGRRFSSRVRAFAWLLPPSLRPLAIRLAYNAEHFDYALIPECPAARTGGGDPLPLSEFDFGRLRTLAAKRWASTLQRRFRTGDPAPPLNSTERSALCRLLAAIDPGAPVQEPARLATDVAVPLRAGDRAYVDATALLGLGQVIARPSAARYPALADVAAASSNFRALVEFRPMPRAGRSRAGDAASPAGAPPEPGEAFRLDVRAPKV